jgi:hypothetical protein
MVSSQGVATEQHVRGFHRGGKSSASIMNRRTAEGLYRSGRIVLQSLFITVSTCTFLRPDSFSANYQDLRSRLPRYL